MITYHFPKGAYEHLTFAFLATIASVQSMKINRHRTLIVKASERVAALEPKREKRIIHVYATHFHYAEAEVLEETEKAYKMRRLGDRRFDVCAGSVAWMPKKALVPMISKTDNQVVENFYETARWFRPNRWQERFLGLAE